MLKQKLSLSFVKDSLYNLDARQEVEMVDSLFSQIEDRIIGAN